MAYGRERVGLTRRSFLWRWGVVGGVLAVSGLVAACGGAPASPEAKPTEAPKPAAPAPTTAPAAAATTAPAAGTKPAATTAPAQTGKKKYEGVTLKYAAIASMGAGVEQILTPWLEETGLKIERGQFEQQEITDKLMQAMATNTHLADVVQFESNSAGDIMGSGFLLELPKEARDKLDWDDIAPAYRDRLLTWNGKAYASPFDGDTHHLVFRRDLAEDPANQQKFKAKYSYDLNPKTGPLTWDEHRNWAEFFTGWDWNKNGKDDDYGFAHMTKRKDTAYWGFVSRVSSLAKHPEEPGFFFDLDTGEPRINNPAWVRALTEWKEELEKWAPRGVLAYGWGEVIQAFTGGQVAMNIGWDGAVANSKDSAAHNKDGYNILPGSKEVYNPKSKKWDTLSSPNYAPFMAFGGWMMAVPKTTKIAEVAWDMILQVTNREQSNKMAFAGISINPVRVGQLEPKGWVDGALKFDQTAAEQYTSALKRTMDSPNTIWDLRIPGWTQYRDALELGVSKGLAGEAPPQAALDEAAQTFSQITNRLGGPKKQMENYKAAIGAK